MTPDKARKMAEETIKQWDDDIPQFIGDFSKNSLEKYITQALLQFAQERESEAVRELVEVMNPLLFTYLANPGTKHEFVTVVSNNPETLGQWRKAAAVLAKHSKKGAS